MQAVQAVGVDVVGKLAGAADAGDDGNFMRRAAQPGQRLLDGAEDSEITAAAAPVRMRVVNPEGLGRQSFGLGYCHVSPCPS